MKFIIALISLFFAVVLPAQIAIDIGLLESTATASLITLKTRNDFDQGLRDARAWVFLFDADGKVVGQKAQWLKGEDSEADSPDSEDLLPTGAEREFSLAIETTATPVRAQVTFSRLILADGTLANPLKDVIPLEDKP